MSDTGGIPQAKGRVRRTISNVLAVQGEVFGDICKRLEKDRGAMYGDIHHE